MGETGCCGGQVGDLGGATRRSGRCRDGGKEPRGVKEEEEETSESGRRKEGWWDG